MYPVKLGFDEAIRRARALVSNGHQAEALVCAVFTVEKTLRRSLRYCIVARGFTSGQADKILGRGGLEELRRLWACFAPSQAQLSVLLTSQELGRLTDAATMRNKLVHGQRAYSLSDCKSRAEHILKLLETLRAGLIGSIGADGWSRLPVRRKATLAWMPPTRAS